MEDRELQNRFMRLALREARRGIGLTSPNPAVGAVLVQGGRVVARGHHRRAGAPHAEVDCLSKVASPAGGVLYVTLEPCSTTGRTAPCTDLIIQRGIRRVVLGALDPNPQHRGRGIELLRAAGVNVESGALQHECSLLNEGFNKWITTGMPFVVAKCAMTLDGRLTRCPGESPWLSSAASRSDAQQLRASVDAILVGAETVRRDNPHLTVRRRRQDQQPWRVILTRSGRISPDARVLSDAHKHRTLVYRNRPLRWVLHDLGKHEITSVLIEGGGQILTQAFAARAIDKVQIYVTPLLTGGGVLMFSGSGSASTGDSLRISQVQYRRIRDDVCVTGYPQ